jgi:hypothetical protein
VDGDVHLELSQIWATSSEFGAEGHVEMPIVTQAQLTKMLAMGLHKLQEGFGVDTVTIRESK